MGEFQLNVNGRLHRVEGDAADSLLSVLRDDLGLTGSKFGCGEGFCGACTILVDGQVLRSCVARLGAMPGKAITTIEGIANGDHLHAVQEAFLEIEPFQCGYCTSGMIVATVGLLASNPNPSDQDIARLMDRNVCRCGEFPRLTAAIKLASTKMKRATGSKDGDR
jgi:nicotinate dehydrogenase subunit A